MTEKCAATHAPALETTVLWLERESTATEDVPGAQPEDFAIRISADIHGPEFQPGAIVVMAAAERPQHGQTVAARISTEAAPVFGRMFRLLGRVV